MVRSSVRRSGACLHPLCPAVERPSVTSCVGTAAKSLRPCPTSDDAAPRSNAGSFRGPARALFANVRRSRWRRLVRQQGSGAPQGHPSRLLRGEVFLARARCRDWHQGPRVRGDGWPRVWSRLAGPVETRPAATPGRLLRRLPASGEEEAHRIERAAHFGLLAAGDRDERAPARLLRAGLRPRSPSPGRPGGGRLLQ